MADQMPPEVQRLLALDQPFFLACLQVGGGGEFAITDGVPQGKHARWLAEAFYCRKLVLA